MEPQALLFPKDLKQIDASHLGITWADGHDSTYDVRTLRLSCRCANCIDEWTREKIIKEETIPASVHPKKITPVGRYAFQINWSDGHDTGFYTFEQLRSQCECRECKTQ